MNLRWKIAQAAEIRWWQRYLKNKNTGDYAAWKKNYWKKLLEEIGLSELLSKDKPAQKILDAGSGPAGIFMVLTPQHEVTALDPLIDDYEKKLDHFKRSFYPEVTFVSQSLESFVDRKQIFDIVFCLNAINHVNDLQTAIDVLIKTVRINGTLVVSIDAHRSYFLKKVFAALPGDILHPHQFTLEEYRQMFLSRGCEEISIFLKKEEAIFNYYVLVMRIGNRLTDNGLTNFGKQV